MNGSGRIGLAPNRIRSGKKATGRKEGVYTPLSTNPTHLILIVAGVMFVCALALGQALRCTSGSDTLNERNLRRAA